MALAALVALEVQQRYLVSWRTAIDLTHFNLPFPILDTFHCEIGGLKGRL